MASGIGGVSGAGPVDPTNKIAGDAPLPPPSKNVQKAIAAVQTLVQATYALNGQGEYGSSYSLQQQTQPSLMFNVWFQASNNALSALQACAASTPPDPSEGSTLQNISAILNKYSISPVTVPASVSDINCLANKFQHLANDLIGQGLPMLSGVKRNDINGIPETYGVFMYAGDSPQLITDSSGNTVPSFPGYPNYPNKYSLGQLMPVNSQLNEELNEAKGTTGVPYYPPSGSTGLWDPASATSPYTVWASAFSYSLRTFETSAPMVNKQMDLDVTSTDPEHANDQEAMEQFSAIIMHLHGCFEAMPADQPLFQGAGFLNLILNTPLGGAGSQSLYQLALAVDSNGNSQTYTAKMAAAVNGLYNTDQITGQPYSTQSGINIMDMIYLVTCSYTDPHMSYSGDLDGGKMTDAPTAYSHILHTVPDKVIDWNDPNMN